MQQPLRYAVMKCGDEWKVVSGRRRIGHFADAHAANSAASGLCRQALDAGHTVEMLFHHPGGELLSTIFQP